MIQDLSDIQLFEFLDSREDRDKIQRALDKNRDVNTKIEKTPEKIKDSMPFSDVSDEKTQISDQKRKIIPKKSFTPTKDLKKQKT